MSGRQRWMGSKPLHPRQTAAPMVDRRFFSPRDIALVLEAWPMLNPAEQRRVQWDLKLCAAQKRQTTK